jgi:hypothetical protein
MATVDANRVQQDLGMDLGVGGLEARAGQKLLPLGNTFWNSSGPISNTGFSANSRIATRWRHSPSDVSRSA